MLLNKTSVSSQRQTPRYRLQQPENLDHAHDIQPIRDVLGPCHEVCVRSKRQKANVSHVLQNCPSGGDLSPSQKVQRCTTKLSVVIATNGSTLQQVDPSSEHAVRWQLAPVVPRLGNIALKLRLKLSYHEEDIVCGSSGVSRCDTQKWRVVRP
ncbi:hypothetical protein BU25DRAFT_12352 [Macroventuria anomochaeta]|uniref:Uncharacterized protein n=1 Tax=Macroventuria anomochaeta TaxID=301207 RepID=A0ACB6SHH4_9PLEO|nr:uncharacterized protein BU25DRAFT_12352 [Macroventuria anomochaeta]KAF2633750.1 hypothetical protein BU25DRAFT_12352 [Macroventuria anomochaeta]